MLPYAGRALAARNLAVALAAFLVLNGCVPPGLRVADPALVAGRLDLKVSPEERAFFANEQKEAKQGPRLAKARYYLGLAEFQDGHFSEAGKAFQKCAQDFKGSGWDLAATY